MPGRPGMVLAAGAALVVGVFAAGVVAAGVVAVAGVGVVAAAGAVVVAAGVVVAACCVGAEPVAIFTSPMGLIRCTISGSIAALTNSGARSLSSNVAMREKNSRVGRLIS